MKAIVLGAYGGADNFEQAQLPMPEVRPNEVVRHAHGLLESHAVQGKLVMTC